MSDDKPTPRPTIPSPAALASRMHPRPVAAPAPVSHSESARFGRVDEEGHVFVTVGDEEREVGSYPGATPDEALQYFARKYDELAASADLLEARLANPDVSAKEVADGLTHPQGARRDHRRRRRHAGPAGDRRAGRGRPRGQAGPRGGAPCRGPRRGHRSSARPSSPRPRRSPAQPPASTQWKTSGERMRALLDEWKQHQRSGAKLDKATESALWTRFSHARNSFDKARRAWFAELETSRAEARATKEALVAEAEELSTSTDWTPTARAFKQLMDRWRAAGRASRAEDDALWERFRTAQDAFFAAKDEVAAAEDEEFRGQPRRQGGAAHRGRGPAAGHRRRGREGGAARHPGPLGEGRQGAARRPRARREADAARRDRGPRGRRAALDAHQPRGRGPRPLAGRPARGVGRLHRGRRRQGRGQGRRQGRRGRPRRGSRPSRSGSPRPAPGWTSSAAEPEPAERTRVRQRRRTARTRRTSAPMGRHGSEDVRRPRGRPRRPPWCCSLVGLLGWRGWVAWCDRGPFVPLAGMWCADSPTVTVTTTPAMEPVLRQVAGEAEGACATFRVTAESPETTAQRFEAGGPRPRRSGCPTRRSSPGRWRRHPVARSPWAHGREHPGGAGRARGPAGARPGHVGSAIVAERTRVPDPNTSTVGRLALMAGLSEMDALPEDRRSAALAGIGGMLSRVVPEETLLTGHVSGPDAAVFPTTEQQVHLAAVSGLTITTPRRRPPPSSSPS